MTLYDAPEHQPFTLGDPGSKKRALLLHGFPGTPAEVRALAKPFTAAGCHVAGPLLPGFGQHIEQLGKQSWQDWLQGARSSWLETISSAEETLLLGYSMGGALALLLAAKLPPSHLILIAPFRRLNDWRAPLLPIVKHFKPHLKPFEDADFDDPNARLELKASFPNLNLDDPEVQRFIREDVSLPTSAVDELRRLGKRAYQAAPLIRVDTLLLQGADDKTVRPADSRALAKRLKRATYLEFPGSHELVKPGQAGHAELLSVLEQQLKNAHYTNYGL